jgi:hypothetical protein
VLLRAEEAVRKYYDIGVLPEKYRGRIPVTFMAELFVTGRCTALSGFDGALSICDMEAASANECPAVRAAAEEAASNVDYLMDSLSKDSQLTRYHKYSDMLSERVLEHITALDLPERDLV